MIININECVYTNLDLNINLKKGDNGGFYGHQLANAPKDKHALSLHHICQHQPDDGVGVHL